MEPMALSFGVMLGFLQQAIAEIKDPRQSSNATRYSIKDTVLGAFSVFFMQCESFLEHQRQMHSRCGQDNAQSLFGLKKLVGRSSLGALREAFASTGMPSSLARAGLARIGNRPQGDRK